MNFINECSHFMPSDLEEVENYFQLPFSIVGYNVYGKLLKDGLIFYAQNCSKSAKRDSSACYYEDTNGKRKYGKIMGFIKMNPPSAIVKPFKVKTQSLLSVAGPACRDTLQVYKDEDILGACDFSSN